MKIEEFLAKLDGVQQGADSTRWTARCPGHDDGQASLGIHVTPAGKILLKCYAGCSTKDIVAAMGLKMSDLFADEWKGKPKYKVEGNWKVFPADTPVEEFFAEFTKGKGKRKPAKKEPAAITPEAIVKPLAAYRKKRPSKHVCYYDYQDETGAKIFRVDRRVYTDEKGGKTFIQQHPNEKGGWDYGVSSAGVQRVPFRLPRILAAAKSGKNVIIVEGEKDVLSVEKALGVVATCNPGGAGKWEAGWGKYFAGVKGVLIVADKDALEKVDEKTGETKLHAVGQRHANKVERLLRDDGFTGSIKKIVLPDVEGEHVKDFTDWVEARQRRGLEIGKSAFQEVIKSSAEWPAEWNWTEDADLSDLQRSQNKGERNTASSNPAEMPGEASASDWMKDADKVGEGVGRFGRLVPRSPFKDERLYEVDFRTAADRVVRIAASIKRFLFRGYVKDAAGKWSLTTSYDPVELKLPAMAPMAFGCMARFLEGSKLPAKVTSEIQAAICLLWLRSRGKFFWDENSKGFATSLFFDESTGVLMRVRSDEFAAFIATAAEINREASGFKYLMSLIDDAAMNDGVSRGVIPSNMWDRRGDTVYISNGDDRMYRLAGGSVQDIQNGTDGVVFMRGKTLAPWKCLDDAGKDPFETALIFTNASWADKTGRMNVRLWTLNLFACHQTKPIMLITGGAGSGKTRMAKAIKEILGVRTDGRLDLSVQQVEDGDKGLDAFWATVNDGKLEVFDNLDTKIKWVSDTLQNVATDGQTKRRTLYTTFGVSILRANAHLILTSNNPIFSTEGNGGMADRLISAHLDLNRSASMDTELSEDIRVNRDAFLTWIAKTVSLALSDSKEVDQSINRRHPDYGRFSVKCGRAIGRETEVVEALGAAEVDKSLLPLRNDIITKEILRILEDNNWSMRFTGGEMSDAIIKRMGDDADDKTRQMYGSRRVGKAMSKYLRQFAAVFKVMDPRTVEGRTVYEITGLTPAGALAMANPVGSVGLKGDFTESTRIETGAGGFSANGNINPPNPPHARAPGDDSPFTREEEGSGNIGDDDDDDLVF